MVQFQRIYIQMFDEPGISTIYPQNMRLSSLILTAYLSFLKLCHVLPIGCSERPYRMRDIAIDCDMFPTVPIPIDSENLAVHVIFLGCEGHSISFNGGEIFAELPNRT